MKDSKSPSAKARKLVLKKDTVRILSNRESKAVVGGARNIPTTILTTGGCATLPTSRCGSIVCK
jgi:hypothetical protein